MIVRAGSGWQTVLADLSLILFMVTAATLSQSDDAAKPARFEPLQASSKGEPLAVYRAGPGAPPLDRWLAGQGADARQMLTIVAQYRPGEQASAVQAAAALAAQAGPQGPVSRIVIEPGAGGISATLAFDSPAPQLARALQ